MNEQTTTIEQPAPRPEDYAPLQTFARSYAQILAGDDPWLPLGNLMHQFFGSYKHLRAELVADPIQVPEDITPTQFRWAVFCVASVEYLCRVYELPCSAWALDLRFFLTEPWYLGIGADLPKVQRNYARPRQESSYAATSSAESESTGINTSIVGAEPRERPELSQQWL